MLKTDLAICQAADSEEQHEFVGLDAIDQMMRFFLDQRPNYTAPAASTQFR